MNDGAGTGTTGTAAGAGGPGAGGPGPGPGIGQQSQAGGWPGAGPAYLPPVTNLAGPDWAAMAEANEREHRRKRLLKVGGAVLGVVLAGGLVATALALQGPDKHQIAGPAATGASLTPDGGTSGSPASASASAAASASASASASGSASPSASASGKRTSASPAAPGGQPGGQPAPGAPDPVAGLQLAGNAQVGPTDGHTGSTLVLHGTADGYAQSNVRVDTNRSFTVSAMIRNNAPTGGRSVISQGSGPYFAFDLGRDYWTGHNQWVFKVQTAAGAQDSTSRGVFSPGNATTGQWTLLTGVYDAGAKSITLYVNGVPAQSVVVAGIWQTPGNVQVGRVMYQGQWTDPWDGAIADAQVWNQALTAGQVAQLNSTGGASAGVPAAASWLLP